MARDESGPVVAADNALLLEAFELLKSILSDRPIDTLKRLARSGVRRSSSVQGVIDAHRHHVPDSWRHSPPRRRTDHRHSQAARAPPVSGSIASVATTP